MLRVFQCFLGALALVASMATPTSAYAGGGDAWVGLVEVHTTIEIVKVVPNYTPTGVVFANDCDRAIWTHGLYSEYFELEAELLAVLYPEQIRLEGVLRSNNVNAALRTTTNRWLVQIKKKISLMDEWRINVHHDAIERLLPHWYCVGQ